MNDNDANIQHVELSLEEAKRMAAFGEAINRLNKNADFQLVILDGYFGDEAKRLVMLTADTTLSPIQQDNTLHAIRGIGELRQFIVTKRAMAEVAAKEVGQFQEDLNELRELDGGQVADPVIE